MSGDSNRHRILFQETCSVKQFKAFLLPPSPPSPLCHLTSVFESILWARLGEDMMSENSLCTLRACTIVGSKAGIKSHTD